MRKKLIAMLLSVGLLLSITSCGDSKSADSKAASASVKSEAAEGSAAAAAEEAPAENAVAAATFVQPPEGTLAGNSLTEVGTFANPTSELFTEKNMAATVGDTAITLYSSTGPVGEYANAWSTDVYGYYVVQSTDGQDINNHGLVDGYGNLVIPCETAWISAIEDSNRFVEVYYADGTCTENDDYIVALQDSEDANKTNYYTGTRKIFDLQNQAFVGNIEVHGGEDSAEIEANNSLVLVESDNSNTLYNAAGNVVMESTERFELSDTMATLRVDDITYVYDENGVRFSTEEDLRVIDGCDYFSIYNEGTRSLVDCDWNPVLSEVSFGPFHCFDDGVFFVETSDETEYQLIDLDGNILYQGTELPSSPKDTAPGWWRVSSDDGTVQLISRKNTITCAEDDYQLTPSDGNGNYTVINTGETLALGSSASTLGAGLVSARDATGKYAVYDLFTGQALTEQAYSNVLYAFGYVYALEGETWHVFQVTQTVE